MSEEERQAEYEARWAMGGTAFLAAFNDLISNHDANDTAAEFVRNKIREIVKDPKIAELLAPKDHPIGTKRICVDTRLLRDLQPRRTSRWSTCESNADRGDHAERACAPADGTSYELDAIVFATGFDAMTGALTQGRHPRPRRARR